MKTHTLILAIMALSIIACSGERRVVEEHAPSSNSNPLTQAPPEIKGDWENCVVNAATGKSTFTKIQIAGEIEIREITYSDGHCQLIDSTRDKTLVSTFTYDMEGIWIKAKLKARRLTIFRKTLVDNMNSKTSCYYTDWKEKVKKEILDVPCEGIDNNQKNALSEYIVTRKDDKLLYGNIELKPWIEKNDNEDMAGVIIKNLTSSDVIPEPGNKKVMWVMPPKSEIFSVNVGTTYSENIKLCDSVLSTFKSSMSSSARISTMKVDLESWKTTVSNTKIELSQAVVNLDTFIEVNKLQAYDDLYEQIEDLEEAIEVADVEYSSCTDDCQLMWDKLKELKNHRFELNRAIRNLGTTRRQVNDYYSHKNEIKHIETSITSLNKTLIEKEKLVKEAEEKHLKMYDHVEGLEGAAATLHFQSRWPQNLKSLIKANPKYKFRYADVKKVVMSYRMLGVNNLPTSTSIMKFPMIEGRTLIKGQINLDAYPVFLTGPTKLTLMAACPFKNPAAFGLKLKESEMLEFEMSFAYKN